MSQGKKKINYFQISSSSDYSDDDVVLMDINTKNKKTLRTHYSDIGINLRQVLTLMQSKLHEIELTDDTVRFLALATYFRIIPIIKKAVKARNQRTNIQQSNIVSIPKINFCILYAEQISKGFYPPDNDECLVPEKDISTYVESLVTEQKWQSSDNISRKFPKNIESIIPQSNINTSISTNDVFNALEDDPNISKTEVQTLKILALKHD